MKINYTSINDLVLSTEKHCVIAVLKYEKQPQRRLEACIQP